MDEVKREVLIISLVGCYLFFQYRLTCYFSFIKYHLAHAGGRRGEVKIVLDMTIEVHVAISVAYVVYLF